MIKLREEFELFVAQYSDFNFVGFRNICNSALGIIKNEYTDATYDMSRINTSIIGFLPNFTSRILDATQLNLEPCNTNPPPMLFGFFMMGYNKGFDIDMLFKINKIIKIINKGISLRNDLFLKATRFSPAYIKKHCLYGNRWSNSDEYHLAIIKEVNHDEKYIFMDIYSLRDWNISKGYDSITLEDIKKHANPFYLPAFKKHFAEEFI